MHSTTHVQQHKITKINFKKDVEIAAKIFKAIVAI